MSILHSLKKIWSNTESRQTSQQPVSSPATVAAPEPQAEQLPDPVTSQEQPPISAPSAPAPAPESQARGPYDPSIMERREEYAALTDKISKVYNALRGQSAFESPAIDELLQLCNRAIALRQKLLPSLAPSDWISTHGEAYKRLAMALEKRGDYQGAAEICLMALKDGAVNDGSQHGMAGRMARMLKRAKTAPTPEMKEYLQKTKPAEKPLPKAAGSEI